MLVMLVQHMWENNTLTIDLILNILVFLANVNADTWVVGLIEVLWKAVEAVIDTWVRKSVQFHDVLRGFHAC